MIVPFRIKCKERLVALTFGLKVELSDRVPQFCWNVGKFNFYKMRSRDYNDDYHATAQVSNDGFLNDDDYKILRDYKKQLDINRILINSKTVVDQIEVDALKEFASSPQAKAFRRVAFSILYDLPQHHLLQSYLRSRGFDVSISKEKISEHWKGTAFEHSAVLKWNVWKTAPKEDWLQSLWSKLHFKL